MAEFLLEAKSGNVSQYVKELRKLGAFVVYNRNGKNSEFEQLEVRS